MTRNNVLHEVKLIRKKLHCDCLDDNYYGVPCRHILAIVVKNQGAEWENLLINKRWEILYYQEEEAEKDPEILPPIEKEEENNEAQEIVSKVLIKKLNTFKINNPSEVIGPGRPSSSSQRIQSLPEKIQKASLKRKHSTGTCPNELKKMRLNKKKLVFF